MDFNNNNSFNPNMNPNFTPTSFDSDNSDPAMCNMTNIIYQIGIIRLNMTHIPNPMIIIFKITSVLHKVHGDSPIPSQIVNHIVHNFHNIYSPILLYILLFLNHQLKKNRHCKGLWKKR